MRDSSVIEISRGAFADNLSFIKGYIGDDVLFSSVVKGNAYGHGIEKFIPLAEQCGVSSFSVFSCDEAYKVQQNLSKKATLIIMGMIDNSELEWAIEHDIEFFVFETDRLLHAVQEAKKQNKKARVHIELETGLNRTGFNKKELEEVVQLCLLHKEHLQIVGFCTHYAGAESIANDSRVKKQIKRFGKRVNFLNEQGIQADLHHTACSAATMSYPKTQMDMVRIGIMQYGFWSSRETFTRYLNKQKSTQSPLKRIISWKSKIMATKEVSHGNFVGYGTTYLAIADMKIAIVPVGYSHGYSRILSNQGRVLVNGVRVSVVGIVNMNALVVDVTEVPNVEKGNEVVLIGTQGDLEITVASFSELSNQLNYELLTRLPQDIPRKIVE